MTNFKCFGQVSGVQVTADKRGKRQVLIYTLICIPTKYLCILVPAPLFLYLVPYLHKFYAVI